MVKYPSWIRSCVLCQRWLDNECIPASAMWGNVKRLDQVVLQLAYRRPLRAIFRQLGKDYFDVERGREAHAILEKHRGVIRSLSRLTQHLGESEMPVAFTCRACSRFYGQRCQPDAVYLRLLKRGAAPTLEVTIVEDKRVFRPTYMLQLYAMGLIFSDFNLMVQRPAPAEQTASELESIFMDNGVLLYEHLMRELGVKEMRVDVYISLNIYRDTNNPVDEPLFKTLFSRDFKIVPEMERTFLASRRRRNRIVEAIEKKKPYMIPPLQTHFTTKPRRRSKVVKKVDERFFLYVPKTR